MTSNSKPFLPHKGTGSLSGESSLLQVGSLNWNILKEDISLPSAVLDLDKLTQNLDWMEKFLSHFDTKLFLAPHGKTTMMPSLFKKVCEKPSTWGITLATATQVQTAHSFGVTKVIMANQLVGKRNMEIISEILEQDPTFEFFCLVDSAKIVDDLGRFFSGRKQTLRVLLEYGPTNGRTGVRNDIQEKEVLEAIKNWEASINLSGVEFFEGVLQSQSEIHEFIDAVISKTKRLITNTNAFKEGPVILTGAGSAWFDIVAEKLSEFSRSNPTFPLKIILRPGCFMIHDIALYNETSSRIQTKRIVKGSLKPALKIWAHVQSRPEPDLAIIAFGKRDGANDCGFPKPTLHFRPGVFDKPMEVGEGCGWEIFKMMDQHTFLKVQEGDDIIVGDIIAFDIAHPCTTLDKWRNVLVMDDTYSVVEMYPTFF